MLRGRRTMPSAETGKGRSCRGALQTGNEGEHMADKASDRDPTIHFYLVKLTPLGRGQPEADIEKDHRRVSDFINNTLRGSCKLYSVPGPYDYVSVVEDIDGPGAARVKHEIERSGFAEAMFLPGYKHMK
jgi:hypothetical protein